MTAEAHLLRMRMIATAQVTGAHRTGPPFSAAPKVALPAPASSAHPCGATRLAYALSMTPRYADVAFVLDSVAGVRAVYAIEPGTRASAYYDFAVALDRSGRVLAEAHYALLRVMTHDECARVFLFNVEAPDILAEGARALRLTPADREAARLRVRPPEPRGPLASDGARERPIPHCRVLLVDDDDDTLGVVRAVLGKASPLVVTSLVSRAVALTEEQEFDLILCDARHAFGTEGLLAKLPLDIARRVLVLATRGQQANARWRLQGNARIVSKPLQAWILTERVTRAGGANLMDAPDRARIAAEETAGRRLTAPPPGAAFAALLVGVEDEVHDALRRVFPEEARHLIRNDPEVAAEIALATPLHLVVCSANAALHTRSVLDAIGREDPAGADGVLVLAVARDVPYLKHKLTQMGRANDVLALPVDHVMLRDIVFRRHPHLAARVAVADVNRTTPNDAPPATPPRYRRLALLVVDDDETTQILFAAAAPRDSADVSLATTPMEAFEHVVSRPVDVLVVSATMRGDGGEPFYRVLWRLKPELKTRCVLVTPPDAMPASVPRSHPPRLVERPLTQDAIRRIVDAFAQR